MNTTYTEQAEKFLTETGTIIETKFLYNGPHFEDDKENRDVYEITIKRPTRSPALWVFKFGQSIAASTPTAYDVLACLTKYDPGTFQNFCDEFGYDTDSRKAEKTYFAVQEEWSNVQRLFGDVIDQLAEIQ